MKKKQLYFRDLILYEDEDIFAINKPPGISSSPDRSENSINLEDLGKEYFSGAFLCHRLDRDTTGVLIFSKHPEAYRHINIQFQKRKVEKQYHAIVHGGRNFVNETINLPLTKAKSKAFVDRKTGKRAVTRINTLEIFRDFTLLECYPETGRFHQIRCHMQSTGSPIVGDALYGGRVPYLSQFKKNYKARDSREENPSMNRMALHAKNLKFTAPSEKLLNIEAPYYDDIKVFIKLLQKYGR